MYKFIFKDPDGNYNVEVTVPDSDVSMDVLLPAIKGFLAACSWTESILDRIDMEDPDEDQ